MQVQLPIYLDAHATTPVDPHVLEEMLPYFSTYFGNAASKQHRLGWRAEDAVEKSRKKIAQVFQARSEEIVFASGATESNNLALFGVLGASSKKEAHLITSSIEHPSLLDPCIILEKRGFPVTRLPADSKGRIDPEEVKKAITPQTVLISIMAANNEIGTLQPLKEIGTIAQERGVFFHTDATQAVGKMDLHAEELHLDLISFSAHKIYGPKGVGGLYVRRKNKRVNLQPILFGGGHERGLRSGTLNVPGIVGMGKAFEIACRNQVQENLRIAKLRDLLWDGLKEGLEGVHRNGDPEHSLSNNLNVTFDSIPADTLMMEMKEIAVSSGSACSSIHQKPSHVLKAIGLTEEQAKSSIRFGLGRFTTEEEIRYAIERIVSAVRDLRNRLS